MSGGLAVQSNCLFFTRTREKEDRREEREKGGESRRDRVGRHSKGWLSWERTKQWQMGGERELGVLVLFFLMRKYMHGR